MCNCSSTLEWSDPSDSIHFGVAVCRNAEPTHQMNRCIPQSPILAYDVPPVGDSQCWNIGDVSRTEIRLLNDSDPSQGIEISYGTTRCCSQRGSAYPGNFGVLGVVIKLVPTDCDRPYSDVWSVHKIEYPTLSLLNCSAATAGNYNIEVSTSRLCPTRIFWKSSSTKSELTCSSFNGTVSCQVIPRLSINSTIDSSLCKRYNIRLVYGDSVVRVLALSSLTKIPRPCSFHVSEEETLQVVEVTDVDGTKIGKTYNIVRTRDESVSETVIVGASVAVGVLALVAVGLLLVCRRRRRKACSDETAPLLRSSPGRTQESVQTLTREPANNALKRDTRIHRHDEEKQ